MRCDGRVLVGRGEWKGARRTAYPNLQDLLSTVGVKGVKIVMTVGHSELCPRHDDNDRISAASVTSSWSSQFLEIVVFCGRVLKVANGSIDGCRKGFPVLIQNVSEDNGDDGKTSAKDENVRSQGDNQAGRRHYGGLIVLGFAPVLTCGNDVNERVKCGA